MFVIQVVENAMHDYEPHGREIEKVRGRDGERERARARARERERERRRLAVAVIK